MSVQVRTRRYWQLLFSAHWKPAVVGVAVTAALSFYVFVTDGLALTVPALACGAAGGFATGILLGKNSIDGGALGFRVGMLGGAVASLGFGVSLFTMWFLDSGQAYFQYSFLLFVLMFFVYAPLNGITGAVGGSVGTILRRTVVPTRYNPPPY